MSGTVASRLLPGLPILSMTPSIFSQMVSCTGWSANGVSIFRNPSTIKRCTSWSESSCGGALRAHSDGIAYGSGRRLASYRDTSDSEPGAAEDSSWTSPMPFR